MEIVIAVLQTGLYQNIFGILLIPILYLFGMMPVSKMFFFPLCWYRYTVQHFLSFFLYLDSRSFFFRVYQVKNRAIIQQLYAR